MKKISFVLIMFAFAFVACKESAKDATTETVTPEAPATTTETPAAPVATETATTTPAPVEPTATVANNKPAAPSSPEPTTKATSKVPTAPITTIKFEESTYDYGTIKDGEKIKHSYKFTNTGKNPLIISDAKGSCGCTVPDWPREPIAPGKTGEIKVEFNSTGKGSPEGRPESKRVTLYANTDPAETYLNIKGVIKSDAKKAEK